jgi:hypothetical protein
MSEHDRILRMVVVVAPAGLRFGSNATRIGACRPCGAAQVRCTGFRSCRRAVGHGHRSVGRQRSGRAIRAQVNANLHARSAVRNALAVHDRLSRLRLFLLQYEAVRAGSLATSICESRQARKGAAVAVWAGAGAGLARILKHSDIEST